MGKRLAAGEVFGEARPWSWSKDAQGRTVGYVSVDATGVGMQGPGGVAAEGKMVDVALVFAAGGEGRPGQMRALAGLYSLQDSGSQLRRQAAQVGLDETEVWVGWSAGGVDLDEFLRVHFPQAEAILISIIWQSI